MNPKESAHLPDPLFSGPLEPVWGLTIADLNRYLPALQQTGDMHMTAETLTEGLFHGDGLQGLEHLPDRSIDLILADPPGTPWRSAGGLGSPFTLQESYEWNQRWLRECRRVLKPSGSLYVFCPWRLSGMIQAVLRDFFRVQNRITWGRPGDPRTAGHEIAGDIWHATVGVDFFCNPAGPHTGGSDNLWIDVIDVHPEQRYDDPVPRAVLQRLIRTSSSKLGWVVDPFLRNGGSGIAAKQLGRRFIGFEINRDRLLLAMKRIDQS